MDLFFGAPISVAICVASQLEDLPPSYWRSALHALVIFTFTNKRGASSCTLKERRPTHTAVNQYTFFVEFQNLILLG